MRHCVDSAGRGKEGCILLRESMSSVNILLSTFLLITGVSCYGRHCCKPVNICVTFQKQDFFSYLFFPLSGSGTKRNRKREYGVTHVFNDRGKTTFSSLLYCCNFYDNFKRLLAEIHWPPKNFDNVT